MRNYSISKKSFKVIEKDHLVFKGFSDKFPKQNNTI